VLDVPAPAVELEVPARPEYVAVVRLALASLGRLAGLDEAAVEDLKIAVSEATTSAMLVNQAAGGSDPVTIAWTRRDGRVVVEICDRGPREGAEEVAEGDLARADISVALLESIVDGCEVVERSDGPGSCTRLYIDYHRGGRPRPPA
jgi:anti-sigma regulatory factor (Ser/Thr protein kinase)